MPEPTATLQALRASTADLLKGLDEQQWSDDDLRAPSLCAGWTRGHVLTHLARNADSVAATLAGALRGEVVARYPTGDAGRDADIEAGSARSAGELFADVAESAERLDRVFGGVAQADAWHAATDDGPAAGWAMRRFREVEVHRVDLAGSYGPDRWPALLVTEELPALAEATTDLRIVVSEDGSVVPTLFGRAWGPAGVRTVTGPDWALLAWLVGRGAAVGDALGDVPAVPPWR